MAYVRSALAVNSDLVKERQRTTFDPEQLTRILYGDQLAKRRHYGYLIIHFQ